MKPYFYALAVILLALGIWNQEIWYWYWYHTARLATRKI